ncbi:MAG TPA: NAD-dependent epimerase/dehydratase family protein [Solirubrobacteraceae bacterium]
MNVLVTGITGYIGSRLAPRLLADGHAVRGLSRRARAGAHAIPILAGDAVTGDGLEEALDGVEVAYFLIHSMEPSGDGPFTAREHAAAENFARAARAAGVERVVYLGGPVPAGSVSSTHLASRLEVERVLLDASPCSVALRASIVIGAGSRSFRFLVRLLERMPVLPVPAWGTRKTSPIDERDIIELLARAAVGDGACGQSLDASGPELVTYAELIDKIREHMLVGRITLSLNLTLTPIASRLAAIIAGEDHELIGPLMESLEYDLLPAGVGAAERLGVRLHSLDAAIEHALAQWEAAEPLAAR